MKFVLLSVKPLLRVLLMETLQLCRVEHRAPSRQI